MVKKAGRQDFETFSLKENYAFRKSIAVLDDEEFERLKLKLGKKMNEPEIDFFNSWSKEMPFLEPGLLGIGGLVLPLSPLLYAGYKLVKYWLSETNYPGFPVPISSAAKLLKLPPGHPQVNYLYVGHPLDPPKYYPLAQFHRHLFENKLWEAIKLLMALGAIEISGEWVSGWDQDFVAKLDFAIPTEIGQVKAGGKASSNSKATSNILFTFKLNNKSAPSIPSDLVWYQYEDIWKEVAEGRMKYGLTEFSFHFIYNDDYGADAKLCADAAGMKLGIGGEFEKHKSTSWKLVGKFNEVDPASL